MSPDPRSDPELFEVFDRDGDALRIGPPGIYATKVYAAFLAVDNGSVYLRREQVEALRDYLNEVLADG